VFPVALILLISKHLLVRFGCSLGAMKTGMGASINLGVKKAGPVEAVEEGEKGKETENQKANQECQKAGD
jgi:hypothetical protein